MTRVHYDRRPTDYQTFHRTSLWYGSELERPRLLQAAATLAYFEPKTVVDPACGDGWTVEVASRISPIEHGLLTDTSAGALAQITRDLGFPCEVRKADLFDVLNEIEPVDAIVLTEVLEHLEDPDLALRLARGKARFLVASSPVVVAGVADHTNEHLWSFDEEGYRQMLVDAGWNPVYWSTCHVRDHPYPTFQIWGCD